MHPVVSMYARLYPFRKSKIVSFFLQKMPTLMPVLANSVYFDSGYQCFIRVSVPSRNILPLAGARLCSLCDGDEVLIM